MINMTSTMGLVYWSMVPNRVFLQLPFDGGDCDLFVVIYSFCKVMQSGNERRFHIAKNNSSEN